VPRKSVPNSWWVTVELTWTRRGSTTWKVDKRHSHLSSK
jgi:hypothetical protein